MATTYTFKVYNADGDKDCFGDFDKAEAVKVAEKLRVNNETFTVLADDGSGDLVEVTESWTRN